MSLIIGGVEFENKVFLAPLAGITDKSFRMLCREQGCAMAYTEMVSAKGLLYNSNNTKALLDTAQEERPVGVQLFGRDPEILGDMAQQLSRLDINLIDINMGCPATKIVKNGEGSALMKEPERIGEIVRAVYKKSAKPVTVKIRKGFDDDHVNAVQVAQIAEENGAAAITVHGRTKEQYYSGKADWDIIRQVKQSVGIPVIGNGDIFDPQSAKGMLEQTGCDGIMIARGAQGNPWIFRQVGHYLETGELLAKPDITAVITMALRHTQMTIAHKGEHTGIREMRKHLGWYMKGMPGAAEMRVKINGVRTYEELLAVFAPVLNKD